jgi:CRISPR system Cascade subunit CasE
LQRQGERLGFKVETALVTGGDVVRGRKGGMSISLLRACFEGILQTRDVPTLSKALQMGIGPGKAFGCGLLSLARY